MPGETEMHFQRRAGEDDVPPTNTKHHRTNKRTLEWRESQPYSRVSPNMLTAGQNPQ